MAINPYLLQQRALGMSYPLVPQVKVFYTAGAVSIPFGTTYTIQWTEARYDTQAMWNPADTTKLSFRTAGLYLFDPHIALATGKFSQVDGFGALFVIGHLRLDGLTTREVQTYGPGISTASTIWDPGLIPYHVDAGSYVEVLLENQSAGTTYSIDGTTLELQCYLGVHLLAEGG